MAAKPTFHDFLVLNRYLLGLFHQKDLSALRDRLHSDDNIGMADDGQTKFFHELTARLFHSDVVPADDLRRYDLNIVRHWWQITEKRGSDIEMKYFQYLSLLFTEIYLDRYFNGKSALQTALNTQLATMRQPKTPLADTADYTLDDLSKIAFWNATGSGKTLLMHVNILQYLHYFSDGTNARPDNIILLTPNEGLSKQHKADFTLSGIDAQLFDKNSGGLFADAVQIIEITRLGEQDGDKTVAVSAFEGNNLILVDEGHRGSSGDVWLKHRQTLAKGGFSFEYSATFGQAAGSGKGKNQKTVFETYAKSILFDYSYKYFHGDGYGKESLILNLPKGEKSTSHKYFTACLLSFYQQLYLFERAGSGWHDWNIEKPLWVFVGHTVNAKAGKGKDTADQAAEKSDIQNILHHLAYFLNQRETVLVWLDDFVCDRAQMTDSGGRHIFQYRFLPLQERFSGRAADLYADILRLVFGAADWQRLRLTQLKRSDGELALSLGNHAPFGVINIGNAADFFKTAQNDALIECLDDDFRQGLFGGINRQDSTLNLLIGAKKFTEGWSSWRVSTMGLMNVGKSEGSQIIQMFGRGVRLKGRNMSLKRSTPNDRAPKNLDKLETLNVFGISADYMDEFKQYLQDEGVDTEEMLTVSFPALPNLPEQIKLKTLRLKEGFRDNQKMGFKRQLQVALYEVPDEWEGKIKPPHFTLDRYPRLQALSSDKSISVKNILQKEKHRLNPQCFAYFDWDKIYLTVQQHKSRQSWFNLQTDKGKLREFVEGRTGWYTLLIPHSEMVLHSFADVLKQQNLLIDLLLGYTERFYRSLKSAYEAEHCETVEVSEKDAAFQVAYSLEMANDNAGKNYEGQLRQLVEKIGSGSLKTDLGWQSFDGQIQAICFSPHLFYPLMRIEKDAPVKLKPLVLQEESEYRFVQDLQGAADSGSLKAWIGNKELYLLRNPPKTGLGFALAGNFYPDFLLWLVCPETGRQWLSFIDPKGIRQMDLDEAKFGLHQEVKRLEEKLADEDLHLSGFILAYTRQNQLLNISDEEKARLPEKNVLFMEMPDYLPTLFAKILEDAPC
ncbi:MAG: DEAD/DEAH box helicase family protein [Neisseria sp.]|nr:DEAD/DEAH box helicase family protein [Neisseria sp.]